MPSRAREPAHELHGAPLAARSRGSGITMPLRSSFSFVAVYGGYMSAGSSFVLRVCTER